MDTVTTVDLEKGLLSQIENQARENYVFTEIRSFVNESGAAGLDFLHEILSHKNVPDSIRYYIVALLAYIANSDIQRECREELYAYRNSINEIERAGAEDGIDYLESM